MNKISEKKYSMKHSLKRLLIKCKLLPCIKPIYEALASLSQKHKAYRRKMLDFYSLFIKKGDLCFDVEAHEGNRTVIFLKLKARVVAVEPQKSCIKSLKSKFGKNPNFVLVGKGLAESEGELTMSICEEADDISTFSEKWKMGRFSQYEWNKKELIQVTTLDNLIKEFGLPEFCKIDVEGFEYQVLKGLSQPIRYLSFEFTKEFFDDTKTCINHLVALSYGKFNYSIGESMWLSSPNWITANNLLEELNSIKDSLLWGDIYAKY